MHTRRTADYSPCRPGSKAENQAYNARREMMNALAGRAIHASPTRKTWAERMTKRARGFTAR